MNADSLESADQEAAEEEQKEYLKFVALLVVMLLVLFCLAWLIPPLFSDAIPGALGLNGNSAVDVPADTEQQEIQESTAPEMAPVEPDQEYAYPVPDTTVVYHLVVEGETLAQIASSYGLSLETLAAANNIINPQQLKAGTVLVIPAPP